MRYLHWIPAIAIAVLIFSWSQTSNPPGADWAPDYVGHSLEYGLFGLTLVWGLTGGFKEPLTWRLALVALAVAIAYGVLDEFHQSFIPRRTPSVVDVMADAAGALIWISAARVLSPQIRRVLRGE